MKVLNPVRQSSGWLLDGLLLSIFCLTLTFHWTKGQMTPETAKDIVMKHNEYRRMERSSDMYQLYWNVSLQKRADGWVQRCDFRHEFNLDLGENLYFDTDHENDVLLRGMKAWYEEKSNWGYTNGHCTISCHFTQMVSSYTTSVGCSAHICPVLQTPTKTIENAMYFACYYYPRGNVIGNFPYKRGLPCSQCGEGDSCDDKLCVSSGPDSKTAPDILKYFLPQKPPQPHRPIKRLADYQSLGPKFKQSSGNKRHNQISKFRHHIHQSSHRVTSRRRQASTRVVITQPDTSGSRFHQRSRPLQPARRINEAVVENSTTSSDVFLSRRNERPRHRHHHRFVDSRNHHRHRKPSHRNHGKTGERKSYNSYVRNGDQSRHLPRGYHNKRAHQYHEQSQNIPQPSASTTISTSTTTKTGNYVTHSNQHQRTNERKRDHIDNRIPQTRQNIHLNQATSPPSSNDDKNTDESATSHSNEIDDGLYQYYQSRGLISSSKPSNEMESSTKLTSGNTIDLPSPQGKNDIRLQTSEANPKQNTPHKSDSNSKPHGQIEQIGAREQQNVATLVRARFHVKKHRNNQQNSRIDNSNTDNSVISHDSHRILDPGHYSANYAVGRQTSRVRFNQLNPIAGRESEVNNAGARDESSIATARSKTDVNNANHMSNQLDKEPRRLKVKGTSSQNETTKRRRAGKKRRRRNREDNETILRRRNERRERRRRQKEVSRARKRYKRRLERQHKKLLLKEKKRREKLAYLEKKRVEKLRRQEKNKGTCTDKVAGCSQRISTCETSLLAKYYCPLTCGLCKSKRREPGGQPQTTDNNVNNNRIGNNDNNVNRQKNYDINSTLRRGDRYNYATKRKQLSTGNVAVKSRTQKPQPYFYRGPDRSYGRRTTPKPEVTTRSRPDVPDTTGPCRDDPRYERGCEHWASIGHCTKNTLIQTVYCRRSCGVCT